jgi:hypothetical protein
VIVTARKPFARSDIVVEVRRRTGTTVFPTRFDVAGVDAAARMLRRCKIGSSEVSALLLLLGALSRKAAPAFFTYRIDSGAP